MPDSGNSDPDRRDPPTDCERFDDGLERDSLYRCVATERRRCVLRYLRECDDDTASLDELVECVLERETQTAADEHVTADLYHTHLPMLSDHGLVDFDPETESVEYDGHDALQAVLQE